jgi:hypothetical protein
MGLLSQGYSPPLVRHWLLYKHRYVGKSDKTFSDNQKWHFQASGTSNPRFGKSEIRQQNYGRRDLADIREAAIQVDRIEGQEQEEEEEAGEEGRLR